MGNRNKHGEKRRKKRERGKEESSSDEKKGKIVGEMRSHRGSVLLQLELFKGKRSSAVYRRTWIYIDNSICIDPTLELQNHFPSILPPFRPSIVTMEYKGI